LRNVWRGNETSVVDPGCTDLIARGHCYNGRLAIIIAIAINGVIIINKARNTR